MALSSQQLRAISWLQVFWNRYGSYPEKHQIKEAGHSAALDLSNAEIVKALRNRGISVGYEEFQPTNEQLAAITAIVNFDDKRTRGSKLKDLGISVATWDGWMKDERFRDFVHELSNKNFSNALHVAQEGLLTAVEDGKVDAIKYYMELTGRAKEADPALQNIRVIMSRIIESIQYRVKDPDIIRLVANDFEEIINGRVPQYMAVEPSRIGDTV